VIQDSQLQSISHQVVLVVVELVLIMEQEGGGTMEDKAVTVMVMYRVLEEQEGVLMIYLE
jgi:hypothetical protein